MMSCQKIVQSFKKRRLEQKFISIFYDQIKNRYVNTSQREGREKTKKMMKIDYN